MEMKNITPSILGGIILFMYFFKLFDSQEAIVLLLGLIIYRMCKFE